ISEAGPLDVLRRLLAAHRRTPLPDLPPFQGGAAGYLAYDWGHELERFPEPRYDDLGLADVVFAVYDWVIAWDHEQSRAWLISTGLPDTEPAARESRAADRAAGVRQLIQPLTERSPVARVREPLRAGRTPLAARTGRAPSYPVAAGQPGGG